MTINVVRGLVGSLQHSRDAQTGQQIAKDSGAAKQATQSAVFSRNAGASDAVVTSFKSQRGASVESDRVKDSKGAKELANKITEKVKGDKASAEDAHQLAADSGQGLLA